MIKFSGLILILFATITLKAQNLDSLYNEFMSIRTSSLTGKDKYHTTVDKIPVKCGFGLVNEVKTHFNRFTQKQQEVLAGFLNRPGSDTSFVTPSGKFRIHFRKSGPESPVYSLSDLAKAVDSSYNFQVLKLGYPAPPTDSGAGGDDLYDIYIVGNPGSGVYGYTETETELGNGRWTSFMVIDNDFSSVYTKGINGARVTVAHEMHHAIHAGNYIYRSSDSFYNELASTAMEEFVFDSINDYYYYIHSYTDNPQRSFGRKWVTDGYDLAVWNIFVKERFGFGILRRIWELMKDKRALNAIAEAIAESGSMFKNEFSLFGQWLYFTGSKAVPGKYFEEAQNYPGINPFMTMPFTKPVSQVNISTNPVSLNYLMFYDNTSAADTFYAIIANSDLVNGVNDITKTLPFKYSLSNQAGSGFRKIRDGYFSNLESDNSFLLSEINIFNNSPIDFISTTEIDYAFPQPFRYSKDSFIYFPAGDTDDAYAFLNVYSPDMDLVFSGEERIVASDKKVLLWNPKYHNGSKLKSGVYIYIVKSGDIIKKGKFVIYND